MKATFIIATSGSIAGLLCASAQATFTGIEVTNFNDFMEMHPNANVLASWINVGDGNLDVYRIYATFNAADSVQSMGGGPGAPFFINMSSGAIFNYTFDHGPMYGGVEHFNLAASAAEISPSNGVSAFDTFATVGRFINAESNGVQLGPDEATFAAEVDNFQSPFSSTIATVTSTENGGVGSVALLGNDSQGIPNDGIYRVLLFQLTVERVGGVPGTFNGNFGTLNGFLSPGFRGADPEPFSISGNALNFSNVPAPGAFALLGIGMFTAGRRRRCE